MDIKKILENPIRWWRKQDTFIRFIVLIIVISAILIPIKVLTSPSTVEETVVENTPSYDSDTTPSQDTEKTTTNSDDYDRGYDEGYFSGVNEAYSGWEFYDEVSSSLQVSDIWRQGYKDGYRQGYSDIQNDMPLQKPRIPGTAILDPRTGEEIYA